MNLLLVNNHPAQATFLSTGLKGQNWNVTTTHTTEQALLSLYQDQFHVIIIKHDHPILNAIELSGEIKKLVKTPIVVLLNAYDQTTYLSLKQGGSDLVFAKPYSFTTLCKHLKLLTSSYKIRNNSILEVYDLRLDVDKRIVKRGKQSSYLRNKEFNLLEYLMHNPNRILNRVQILEHVWDRTTNMFTNTVDVHINVLRKKIDKSFHQKLIHTIPCVGYMLSDRNPETYY